MRTKLLTQPAKPQCQELGGNEAAARAVCPLSLLQLTAFMPEEGMRKHFI